MASGAERPWRSLGLAKEDPEAVVAACAGLPEPEGDYLEEGFLVDLMATVVDFQPQTPAVERALRHFRNAYMEYHAYRHFNAYHGALDETSTSRAVMDLVRERPEWVPLLQAACACAERAEEFDGEVAGAWDLSELKRQTGDGWRPGLRTVATYGLLEKSGASVRGGRRAYYRMPDRSGGEAALVELRRRKIIGNPTAREGAAR